MFRFSPRSNQAHLVHWREWGEEAFAEARQQDKPVALFLTAFWCGYCQRLDETALSNEEITALLNAFFIPVRVEESQRPDVDLRYNQDGWPTIAFLTPEGDHLLSVNYTEPEPFANLLARLVRAYQQDRESIREAAGQSREEAAGATTREPEAPLGPAIVAEVAGIVEGLADREHGGYGTGHKYLHPEANEFFLYLHQVTGQPFYLDHVRSTLAEMGRRRIFDARGGGFFRYSSRPDWQEPHPEKLLEDQAALLSNHLQTYLLTRDPDCRRAAEGLIDYLEGTLWDPDSGAYFGCQDYVRPEYTPGAGPGSGPPELRSIIDRCLYCDANARLASAYLEAWWLLGREDCRDRAVAVLDRLWQDLRAPGVGMCHYWDGQARVPGLLVDAVATGAALLDAYALLGDTSYLERAALLAEEITANHRNPRGGFQDIGRTGPASLRFPVTVLTQNARAAAFFVRLADLSGNVDYRKSAHWALRSFPNTHRNHEAFAAGYGHALARLLNLPLVLTLQGQPGSDGVRDLARAGLTQLGHGDLVLRFRADPDLPTARVTVETGGRSVTLHRPEDLRPEVILAQSPAG